MPNPDQRHLRRAADAAAGKDDATDIWVVVQHDPPPFEALVFHSVFAADAFLGSRPAGEVWHLIPCRGENPPVPSSLSTQVLVVDHGEYSPTRSQSTTILKTEVKRFGVTIEFLDGRASQTIWLDPFPGPQPFLTDAIFLSMEAVDKYVMPNLVSIYGAEDAAKIRDDLVTKLGSPPGLPNSPMKWLPGA